MTAFQQVMLIVLRTLIGWHFAYEGYVKLVRPAWGADGLPLAPWSSAGYLRGATGPLAGVFSTLGSSSWVGTLDVMIPIALALVGLSLILGLFTQAGCIGAMGLLTTFYLSAIPTSGLSDPRLEGTYLLVNKNLIELAAVAVIFAFRTGYVAGLDRWFATARARRSRAVFTEAAA
jgi:thiosulfate dehydrogenase [quinone] large subunit